MCRTDNSDCDRTAGLRHTFTDSLRSTTRAGKEDFRVAATDTGVGVGVFGFTSAEDDLSSLRTEERETERSVTLTPESLEPSP